MSRVRTVLIMATLVFSLLFGAARLLPATDFGRGMIMQALEGAKLGQFGQLHLRGLSGDPWEGAQVAEMWVSDAKGRWIEAHDVRFAWRPLHLFLREAYVDRVRASQITVLRNPVLTSPEKPEPPAVKVTIRDFQTRLNLSSDFSVVEGEYDLKSAGSLDLNERVHLDISLVSRTRKGDHLRLVFSDPKSRPFQLSLSAHEAQGGAIAGALGLAAHAPFDLTAEGRGTPKSGRFSLNSRLGDLTPYTAFGSWERGAISLRADLALDASHRLDHLSAQLGPHVRLAATGHALQGDQSEINLQFASDNLALGASGRFDLGSWRAVGPGLTGVAQTGNFKRLMDGPDIGATQWRFHWLGDLDHWTGDGAVNAQTFTLPGYQIANAQGTIKVKVDGAAWLVEGRLHGAGGAGAPLAELFLGDAVDVEGALGSYGATGWYFKDLKVVGRGGALEAHGRRALFGGVDFSGSAKLLRLHMHDAAGRSLVEATWRAHGDGALDAWSFLADGQGRGLENALPFMSPWFSGQPKVNVKGQWNARGWTLTQAVLEGVRGRWAASGYVANDGTLDVAGGWSMKGPLTLGPLEIDGQASGRGDWRGDLDHPILMLDASLAQLATPLTPMTAVRAETRLSFLDAGPTGELKLNGQSDYGPITASGHFNAEGDLLTLSDLNLDGAGVRANGLLVIDRYALKTAHLAVAITPGAILRTGAGDGRIDWNDHAEAIVGLRFKDAVLRSGGMSFSTLSISGQGPASHLPLQIQAEGRGAGRLWRVQGRGEFSRSDDDNRLEFIGKGRWAGIAFETRRAAELDFGVRGVRLSAAVNLAGGTADLAFSYGANGLAGTAGFRGLSAASFDPDLVGVVEGEARIAKTGDALEGTANARLSNLGLKHGAPAGLLSGRVTARLAANSLALEASVGNRAELQAEAQLAAPVTQLGAGSGFVIEAHRPATGLLKVDGDIGPLWELVTDDASSLTGSVHVNARLSGDLADPRLRGALELVHGRYRAAGAGVTLNELTMHADLEGDAAEVGAFSAEDTGKGRVTGAGRLSLFRDAASTFRVHFAGFRLFDNDRGSAVASGDTLLSRGADGHIRLSGALTIDRAVFSTRSIAGGSVTPMDVVEINTPQIDPATEHIRSGSAAPPIALDVTLKAPAGIIIKGRGLNLDMGLNARVTGFINDPRLTGEARVVRGDYDFAGQRFQLDERSFIRLATSAEDMRLDLLATRENPTLTAIVRILGPVAKPDITITSNPALPKDEVLSQVLFGASTAQLSPYQAAQLASAVTGLARGGGLDVIGGLRGLAHLDRLAIASDATGARGPTIAGGKYLRENVYVEFTGGGREGPGAQVEWRAKPRLALVSRVTSQGDHALSIRWRKDF